MAGTVRVEGDNLVLELHGVDEILAIKRSIIVPLKHILSVGTDDLDWSLFQGMRVAGASLPGILKDGRYLTSDGMMFFEMHHPDRCITLNLNNETYKKIVFEVGDKEAAALMIRGAIEARK